MIISAHELAHNKGPHFFQVEQSEAGSVVVGVAE
jgi:hypothetical protein